MKRVYKVYKMEKRKPKFRQRLYTETIFYGGKYHVSTEVNTPSFTPIYAERWLCHE